MADQITLDAFRASVLAAWAGDPSPAYAAASESVYHLVVTHSRAQLGVILISVPDQPTQRAVLKYLQDGFFKDHEKLAHIGAIVCDEGVKRGGVSILVLLKSTTRRPRHVLERIEVAISVGAPAPAPAPVIEMTPGDITCSVAHCLAGVMSGEREPTEHELSLIAALGIDTNQLRAKYASHHRAQREQNRKTIDGMMYGVQAGSSLEGLMHLPPPKLIFET